MRHSSRNMGDSDSEDDFNYWNLDQEILEEKNFNICSRSCCDILLKRVTVFALVRKICLRLK